MKNKSNEHKITLQDIKTAIKKIESQQKREVNASICDIAEIERQRKLLIQYISQKLTETKNHNIFNVFDNEAGFGKTRIGLNALPYFIKNNLNSRVLWVGEETSEIDSHVAYLNDLFQKEVAIAIHSKNGKSKEPIKALEQYTFVFITHERYRRLSLNAKERELYTNNRDLLIIDEYVDMTKNVDLAVDTRKIEKDNYIIFNRTKYIQWQDKISRLFGANSNMLKAFEIVTKELNNVLEFNRNIEKATLFGFEKYLEKIHNELKETPINTETFNNTQKKEYRKYKKIISDLKNFYIGSFIIEEGKRAEETTLKVPNYEIEMWGLKRNIILDASAQFHFEYTLNPNIYKIHKQKKVFNYHKWELINVKVNSTTSGKTKYKDYDETVNKIIKKLGEDNTLVVTTKDNDVKPIDKSNPQKGYKKIKIFFGTVTHWGDFKGKNEYGKLQHEIIEDSNWLWYSDYILKYLYYARHEPNKNIDLKYNVRKRRFDSALLQIMAENMTIDNYYQAVKRINRNMEYESRVCIMCDNERIFNAVVGMLPNCKHSVKDNVFEKIKKDRKIENPKEKKQINACIELLTYILEHKAIPQNMLKIIENNDKLLKKKDNIIKGLIPKHLVRETLNMENKQRFNSIIHSKEMVEFLTNNSIGGLKKDGKELQNFIFPFYYE